MRKAIVFRVMEPGQGRFERARVQFGPGGALGARLTFLFGLLLAMSALTGWYTGEGEGTTVSVIGWHTGTIGKIVLLLGLVAVLLAALREFGIELPPAIPESLRRRVGSASFSSSSARSYSSSISAVQVGHHACFSPASRSPARSSATASPQVASGAVSLGAARAAMRSASP